MLAILYAAVFLIGCLIGGFLTFCAARLPYEKSLLWPGPRCFACYQPMRWYECVPVLGFLLSGGKCPTCGVPRSRWTPLAEFLIGLAFVGLFHLEIVRNVLELEPLAKQADAIAQGQIPLVGWAVFLVHGLLLSLLLIVTLCDIEHLEIPLSVTVTGTCLGLVVSVLCPWPWPGTQALPPIRPDDPFPTLQAGLYPWPVWHELPPWMGPGTWTLGLATGLAGALVGMVMLRGVRFLFGLGRGIEGLGMGDADLMMMAGAFVGWQPVVLAFFVAVLPALVLGLLQLIIRGDQAMPFGPPLCAGVLLTLWCWPWLGTQFQVLLWNAELMGLLVLFGAIFLLGAAFGLRLIRGSGNVPA